MSAFKIHFAWDIKHWPADSVGAGATGACISGVKKAEPFLVFKEPMCATHSYAYLWQNFTNSVDS